ncbi:hypothetical protein, partial [Staphylococcus aureus]
MDFIQMLNAKGKNIQLPVARDFASKMAAYAYENKDKFHVDSNIDEMVARQDATIVRAYLEDNQIALADVLAAYGFDNIGKTRVKALYQNDGTKPLFNAVVEDYMREAFEKQFS